MKSHFVQSLTNELGFEGHGLDASELNNGAIVERDGEIYDLNHGDVVIAAITSCTNTSNPDVMLAAGLVARKARSFGLNVKPWVRTSLAPGSRVVTEYYEATGLQEDLNALGFNVVGYGCTTCIGNSSSSQRKWIQRLMKPTSSWGAFFQETEILRVECMAKSRHPISPHHRSSLHMLWQVRSRST